jgi:hypothetical protein
MITVDFCVIFTQLLPLPTRRKADQHMVDLISRGRLVPENSVFSESDIHSLFGSADMNSSNSPVVTYFKVYSFMMANQEAFVQRIQQS